MACATVRGATGALAAGVPLRATIIAPRIRFDLMHDNIGRQGQLRAERVLEKLACRRDERRLFLRGVRSGRHRHVEMGRDAHRLTADAPVRVVRMLHQHGCQFSLLAHDFGHQTRSHGLKLSNLRSGNVAASDADMDERHCN